MTYIPPLILIGSHRSGTSLLARLLRESGVFMGAKRNQHDEAEFFFRQNERIMRLAHAEWDVPAPMAHLLTCQPILSSLIAELEQQIEQGRSFLGDGRYKSITSLKEIDGPWGWKDPRSTITLPVWLQVFPDAKILHIARNGIDVAASLQKREKRRRNKLHNGRFSCRCMSLEGAFSLWVEYETACTDAIKTLPDHRVYTMRYEDFLSRPAPSLQAILAFAGITITETTGAELTQGVNSRRAYAFRRNLRYRRFYRQKRTHPLMRQLGYDQI